MLSRIALIIAPIIAFFVCPCDTFTTPIVAQTRHNATTTTTPKNQTEYIKNVLFIGDSMTGWMAERLQAYGLENDFEVTTVLWDGSTIAKWGSANRVKKLVDQYKPDVVFISLGMNELLEPNPEKRLSTYIDNILAGLGDTLYFWVGPPTWPGKGKGEKLNNWLDSKLKVGHYFHSDSLSLARQSKSNPHPTKAAIQTWIDTIVKYIDENEVLDFKTLNKPTGVQMKRGKVFIYKRMKDTL